MFCLKWLIDHGALPKEKEQMFYASYVAGIFRTVRFGIAEAHGAGEMMEFNYLLEQGAIRAGAGAWRRVRNRFRQNPRRDCVAREGVARAGSDGRSQREAKRGSRSMR